MKRYEFVFILFALLIGTACSPTREHDAPITQENTPTPQVLADCFQSATAKAWLDINGDGALDEGEPPLAGIEFVLEPTVYSRATSDANGIAAIVATTPGETCPDNQQVVAVGFEGYTLTTEQSLDYVSVDTVYAFGFQSEVDATRVETDSYTGAIFSAEKTAVFIRWLDEPAESFWTPTADDVAKFETGLSSFIEATDIDYRDTQPILDRLSEYTRQYFGIVQGESRLIFSNFFCDGMGMDWEKTAVIVEDGGDCYFQVIYNVDDSIYTSFWINGES